MSGSVRHRHDLFVALEQAVGEEHAETMMSLLPPVGWADVATKHDLLALEERIDLRFAAVDHRFDALEHRFTAIDQRFDAIDQRFDAIDRRFGEMESRFEGLERVFLTKVEFERELRTLTSRIVFAVVASQTTMAALVLTAIGLTR